MIPKMPISKGVRRFSFAIFSILVSGIPIAASSQEIAAVGPVEAVSCRLGSVTVLGITFIAKDSSARASVCRLGSNAELQLVGVVGTQPSASPIVLTQLTLISRSGYVSGATTIYLRGTVATVNVDVGSFSIGNTAVMHDSTGKLPDVGSAVEVVGIQPVSGGIVIPDAVISRSELTIAGSIGTGRNGSIGTGLNGSIGTGINDAFALERNGSIGTGRNGSMGTGLSGSIGTGRTDSSTTGMTTQRNGSIGTGIN